ncbi:hypothetical protein EC973_008836 [Apophysomyces ossiformis]|uniref:Uncharacterized protein n=1 Tax=Apophysomyces ossiformis TaxID=679940 RepID=A0A8H7EVB5_9FUNG|nr:hypothetical protein EC973_008836 [Apophysomyces ossiformis]
MVMDDQPSYQDQFISLLKKITQLQWVRESLPSHSKYYEGLRQRYKREQHLHALYEKKLEEYRKRQDAVLPILRPIRQTVNGSSSEHKREETLADLVEPLRQSQEKIIHMEAQMADAEEMLQDLMNNKLELDSVCDDMHTLYDEVVLDTDTPAYVVEQHLKNEVIQLSHEIPEVEHTINVYVETQKCLYDARQRMEQAMMSLPGASTFLDRQAMASHSLSNAALFGKSSTLTARVDATIPSLKEAEKLANEAYRLVEQASKLCKDVPVISNTPVGKDANVMTVLTGYRGYRLKIEALLRTQINPRLNQLQSQLAMTKYHYEQKTIEWIDQQIVMLENVLRENGCLQNISLEREISMLRMGSNAAIVAAAAEASGRVTVDDALDVETSPAEVERNGQLPQYTEDARYENHDQPSPPLSSSEQQSSVTDQPTCQRLPAYTSDGRSNSSSSHSEYDGFDQPPAYSR